MRIITVFLISITFMLHAEKYAVICTELPENSSLKEMETAWKTTFLKWEELTREFDYKIEDVRVLYCDGYDFYERPEGDYLDVRFRPQRYCVNHITMHNVTANKNNLDSVISSLSSKISREDDLQIYRYDLSDNIFIKLEYKAEGKK